MIRWDWVWTLCASAIITVIGCCVLYEVLTQAELLWWRFKDWRERRRDEKRRQRLDAELLRDPPWWSK